MKKKITKKNSRFVQSYEIFTNFRLFWAFLSRKTADFSRNHLIFCAKYTKMGVFLCT
jgi:hypothetical protein